MALIGLGGNLPSRHGGPRETLERALGMIEDRGMRVVRRSRWYHSAPVPVSDQPLFVNAVAEIEALADAGATLQALHAIEAELDRRRGVPNAARTVDLDLLDHGGVLSDIWPVLPHPRLHERGFVLIPLRDVMPGWRHPRTHQTIGQMLSALPPGQEVLEIQQDDTM